MTKRYFRIAGPEASPQPIALSDRLRPQDAARAIIFLDIDGVLNRSSDNRRAKNRAKNRAVSHVVAMDLLARFKSLVLAIDAYVVLASTWRHAAGGVEKARELGIPFEDILPDLRPQSRGAEVKAWLASHPHSGRFAIIDDDDDGYGNMPLFQPNPHKGLTNEIVAAVAEYFAGQRNDDYRRSLLIRTGQYLKGVLEGHRG